MQAVTLKELKDKKEFNVTRIDKEFISNEDVILNFEKQVIDMGYKITDKQVKGNAVNYVILNPNAVEELRYYMGSNPDVEEFTKSILNKQTREVLSHHVEDNDLYVKVQGEEFYHSLWLKNSYLKKEMNGKIVLRSKDYYFEYTDEDNKVHKLYSSSSLKASMIQDNKIVVENYPIEYIIE